MKDKKKWVIGLLCTLVCIMAVGYALLAQQLNINGSASIDSTWKVQITNIQENEVIGKAISKVTPSYTSTMASFSVGLTQPGDSITYDVEISNLGTLDAKVDSININVDENDTIKYTTSGVVSGDKLASGEKATLTIKVEYDSSVTSQPSVTTNDITVTINYIQDLKEESSITYQTYSIGDVVTFAGSNWYVIKNSTSEEDYVTLMKEIVLTNAELGEYAVNDTYDTMAYYWSDTCHYEGTYGYENSDDSGCDEHGNYEESKVKEMLESQYLPILGSDNLKEVDGYKIRLITYDEIMQDLGAEYESKVSFSIVNLDSVPVWIYQNFGEKSDYSNSLYGYWTMSQKKSSSTYVWSVNRNGTLHVDGNVGGSRFISYIGIGVRPVINLLKSSI